MSTKPIFLAICIVAICTVWFSVNLWFSVNFPFHWYINWERNSQNSFNDYSVPDLMIAYHIYYHLYSSSGLCEFSSVICIITSKYILFFLPLYVLSPSTMAQDTVISCPDYCDGFLIGFLISILALSKSVFPNIVTMIF